MSRPTPPQFLETVTPALQRGDIEQLRDIVLANWTPPELCPLLHLNDLDLRRTVIVTLGVVGGQEVVGNLTHCLRDPDDQVHHYAEDALWSIWFRIGKPAAAKHFQMGIAALADDELSLAADEFAIAAHHDPNFAEAYNQLAIVYYLDQKWTRSRSACRKALALMPMHFGALAGLGHVYAHCGEIAPAIDAYRRALAINPRMPGIAHVLTQLQDQYTPAAADGIDSTTLLQFRNKTADASDPEGHRESD